MTDAIQQDVSTEEQGAQLTAEEKNAISHRGNALRAFAKELEVYLNKN